ncbi:MAG: hypothetical protein WD156_09290 [Acidimicrobiia bacterium]
MPTRPASATDGLTRRQVLKRGAALGAASLWTTPALQLVRMSSARAAETSGSTCVTYCIKWDVSNQAWESLGNGAQACLTCPPGALNDTPPDTLLNQFTVSGDPEVSLTVRYPSSCSLLVLDALDEITNNATAAGKCGTNRGPFAGLSACSYVSHENQEMDGLNAGTGEFFLLEIPVCENGRGISHIEMIVQCCDHETSA